ncbi:MAG: hypothetical protein KA123_01190 [Candidatus Eisenbacteria bacterium]|nr:hypothetical protein [Candidatus Eisenbacteria bacterium]
MKRTVTRLPLTLLLLFCMGLGLVSSACLVGCSHDPAVTGPQIDPVPQDPPTGDKTSEVNTDASGWAVM